MLQIYSRVPSAEASRAVVTTVVRVNAAQTVAYYRQYRYVLAASPYKNASPVTEVYRPPASIDTPTAAKPVQTATTSRNIEPALPSSLTKSPYRPRAAGSHSMLSYRTTTQSSATLSTTDVASTGTCRSAATLF